MPNADITELSDDNAAGPCAPGAGGDQQVVPTPKPSSETKDEKRKNKGNKGVPKAVVKPKPTPKSKPTPKGKNPSSKKKPAASCDEKAADTATAEKGDAESVAPDDTPVLKRPSMKRPAGSDSGAASAKSGPRKVVKYWYYGDKKIGVKCNDSEFLTVRGSICPLNFNLFANLSVVFIQDFVVGEAPPRCP